MAADCARKAYPSLNQRMCYFTRPHSFYTDFLLLQVSLSKTQIEVHLFSFRKVNPDVDWALRIKGRSHYTFQSIDSFIIPRIWESRNAGSRKEVLHFAAYQKSALSNINLKVQHCRKACLVLHFTSGNKISWPKTLQTSLAYLS